MKTEIFTKSKKIVVTSPIGVHTTDLTKLDHFSTMRYIKSVKMSLVSRHNNDVHVISK